MKKPITIAIPHCNKCKKKLEPRFTTEKEEGDESKPELIMVFGVCKKCNLITISSSYITGEGINTAKCSGFSPNIVECRRVCHSFAGNRASKSLCGWSKNKRQHRRSNV